VQPSALRDAALWLTTNYRFGADSGIGRLAKSFNEGRAEEAMGWLRSAPSHPGTPAEVAPSSPEPGALMSKGKKAKSAKVDEASLSLFPELDRPAVIAGSSSPSVIADLIRNPGLPDSSVLWLEPDRHQQGLRDAILAGYAPYFDTVLGDPMNVDAITRAFGRFRVLCAVRAGASGVSAINGQVTRHARQDPAFATAGRDDSRSPWYLGRPVMVLRNDYVLKLFNGDVGIALPDGEGELAVFFPDGENGYRAVPTARMPEHETAYAMTVHKAQGSEFEAVLLALPLQYTRVVARELLYTAVTRAKHRVTLSASSEVVAQAVATRSKRHSGLLARLRDSARFHDSPGTPQAAMPSTG
jgi:ATP-dependent exoDNAse (exonuclease V) alpha subunit